MMKSKTFTCTPQWIPNSHRTTQDNHSTDHDHDNGAGAWSCVCSKAETSSNILRNVAVQQKYGFIFWYVYHVLFLCTGTDACDSTNVVRYSQSRVVRKIHVITRCYHCGGSRWSCYFRRCQSVWLDSKQWRLQITHQAPAEDTVQG